MIFDIAASIGTKRKYLVLNGVDVTPFEFPTRFTETASGSSSSDVELLTVSRSHTDNAITFETGSSSNDYRAYGTIKTNGIPDIKEYKKLYFVLSFEESLSDGNFFGLSLGRSHYEYDVSSKFTQAEDGRTVLCEFDLSSFYDVENIQIQIYYVHSITASNPPCMNIHHIYVE